MTMTYIGQARAATANGIFKKDKARQIFLSPRAVYPMISRLFPMRLKDQARAPRLQLPTSYCLYHAFSGAASPGEQKKALAGRCARWKKGIAGPTDEFPAKI